MLLRTTTLPTLLLAAAGCGDVAARAPRNVVLVCIDTLRADHLGSYGYDARETSPFLDRVAAGGTRFAAASATAGWTKPSVPSFLTGTYPLQHGVYRGSARAEAGAVSDVLPADALTLAEVFQDAGYQTAAFVKNAQLRAGQGFEQGFERYVDGAGDAREIRWRAGDWLDERDPERPFFLYLHLLDVHWPYPVPDEYAARWADPAAVERFRGEDWRALRDAVNSGSRELDAAEHQTLLALYDGAVRYVDDQLGRLWARLERDGLAEDTVLCVVSDHGEEFGEHGRIGHGHGLYEGLLHVPWLLSVPGHGPAVVDVPCSLVDLFPTLIAAAGLGRAAASEGVDRLAAPAERRLVFAEHLEPGSYHQAWRRGDDKVVHVLRPPVDGGQGDQDGAEPTDLARALALAMDQGARFEARVALDEDGALRATRLRWSAEQDEGRGTELKGPLEALDGDALTVLGVSARRGDGTELYGATTGADGAPRAVAVGMLVKLRGAFGPDGLFAVEKLKLYPDDEETEREVRGRLEPQGPGLVHVGGVEVRVDGDTDVELGDGGDDLDRAAVLALVGAGPGAVREELRRYDLARDPRELAPAAEAAPLLPAPARAVFLERLLGERVWTLADESVVDEAALEALRAIGYAE